MPKTIRTLPNEVGAGSRHRNSHSSVGVNTNTFSSEEREEHDNTKEPGTDSESEQSEDSHTLNLARRGTLSKSYTEIEERNVLRKLDRRLTLFLCLLYLLSFLDRSNIGNARVAGLQTSLGITSDQFDWTLTAFYITYITFEWMILLYRLVPPHIYIAACVFSWGLVACLQATVRNFTQLLLLRALLGITEAAFGPGVPFYMTFFYRREELAYRVGLQISAAPLATSFASSLAWLIVKLSDGGPLESWRALFLFEGAPSLVAAVVAFYLIPDSPETIRWLSPRERKIASLRVRDQSSSSSHQSKASATPTTRSALSRSDLLSTLSDPKSYLPALMFLSVNVSFASLPVFLPTVINAMSFSPLTSQLLASPPYLVAFVFVLFVSRASDRRPDSRAYFLMACASLSCLSYAVIAVTGFLASKGRVGDMAGVVVRYIAVYGAAMGLFGSVVLVITWQLNNQPSESGRGMAMTMLNVVGQCGPLVGVRVFPGRDAPQFVRGMAVCASFMGGVVVLAAGLRVWLGVLNRRVDEQGGFELVDMHGREGRGGSHAEAEADAEEVVGLVGSNVDHRRPRFRFML